MHLLDELRVEREPEVLDHGQFGAEGAPNLGVRGLLHAHLGGHRAVRPVIRVARLLLQRLGDSHSQPVLLPKSNRWPWASDTSGYCSRHEIKRILGRLQRYRRVALPCEEIGTIFVSCIYAALFHYLLPNGPDPQPPTSSRIQRASRRYEADLMNPINLPSSCSSVGILGVAASHLRVGRAWVQPQGVGLVGSARACTDSHPRKRSLRF